MDNSQPSGPNKLRKVGDVTQHQRSSAKTGSSGDENEDSDVRVGYYNANFSASVENPGGAIDVLELDVWLEELIADVRKAIRVYGFHVVCLVGMGSYSIGLDTILPDWLDTILPDGRTKALLTHIVSDLPSAWDAYSFGSYGVLISRAVNLIARPKVVDCEVREFPFDHVRPYHLRSGMTVRPMISFEIAHAAYKPVLQNRFQVWVVENDDSSKFLLTAYALEEINKFLLKEASDRAIWGGKLNTSIPSLEAAGRPTVYTGWHNHEWQRTGRTQESATGNAWTVLPSTTGVVGQLALYRNVTIQGFDIPCAKHATFFGVVVRQDADCVAKPTGPTSKAPVQ
jgi:hypothetical protein